MKKALAKIEGLLPKELKAKDRNTAMAILHLALHWGRPVVCIVDSTKDGVGSHWVAVIGELGTERVLVADSAANELVISMTVADFSKRWECSGDTTPFYGVRL